MKVLQVIDSLPRTSGGARFVVNLAKKIAARNIVVEVLLIDGQQSHFLNELTNAGINVINLAKNTKSRYNPRYVRQIGSIIANFDVVNVHVFPASYVVAMASFLDREKTPIIFTEHATYNRRATNSYFKFVEKFIYHRFIKVVAISEAVQIFVQKNLDIADEKISVIDNGVDFHVISQSLPVERKQFNFSSTDILVLMAARFADEKDHGTVISAFVKLPHNFKLIFAGDGPNLERYRKMSAELGVLGRVSFLGARSDIYRIIQMSDINILSSHYEGFGLSAVEAMAACKPVIATNVPGVAEVVGGAGLLFNVGDHEELTQLILKLGTDHLFYNEISQRCLERAKKYDIEIMTDKYISLYREVLKSKDGQ